MTQAVVPSEKTLLLLMDTNVDVGQQLLDKQYRQEEHEAIEADRHTPLQTIWLEEALSLAGLAMPITLVIVLEVLPPILVSMMIGQVSGDASPQVLAGSSLSDFFQGQVTNSFSSGLSAAVATLCAQSFGARQYRQLWLYAQAGLLSSFYCLVPIGLMCLNGASLLRLVGQEHELARIAGVLIVIAFLAFPFMLVYTVARAALQAQNIATPFLVASVVSYAISLPLGFYLGNHTSLGYVGIALSNVVGQLIRALAVLPIHLRNEIFITSWPGWQWREAPDSRAGSGPSGPAVCSWPRSRPRTSTPSFSSAGTYPTPRRSCRPTTLPPRCCRCRSFR